MKKAVISTGGKQYVVSEGETLAVELLKTTDKTVTFEPLLVIDETKIAIGTPTLSGVKVTAEITDAEIKADKVTSIRYKAKKRVHTVRGHRQNLSRITVKTIK